MRPECVVCLVAVLARQRALCACDSGSSALHEHERHLWRSRPGPAKQVVVVALPAALLLYCCLVVGRFVWVFSAAACARSADCSAIQVAAQSLGPVLCCWLGGGSVSCKTVYAKTQPARKVSPKQCRSLVCLDVGVGSPAAEYVRSTSNWVNQQLGVTRKLPATSSKRG